MVTKRRHIIAICVGLMALSHASYAAQQVPSSAEIERVKPKENQPTLLRREEPQLVPAEKMLPPKSPEGAKDIMLVLKGVEINGATIFTPEELKETYAGYLNKQVSLEVAWVIAGNITKKYTDAGYFLSRAYVPQQEIDGGIIKINVIEGYVGEVELDPVYSDNYIIKSMVSDLKTQKPIKTANLESFLLRLNDLPGLSFRGILADSAMADESAILLKLVSTGRKNEGSISLDNFGSRFLGPHQLTGAYSASFAPMHNTSFAAVKSIPTKELTYGSIEHTVALAPNLKLQLGTDRTYADLGYTLARFKVESLAASYDANLDYQIIRQRLTNLSFRFSFQARDTNTKLLGTELTHDNVRVARANIFYDLFDKWNGYNSLNLTYSHGLNLLGSSKAGDINLSRENAKPNFQKISLFLSRQQGITENLFLISSFSAQKAGSTLYSSEAFGYGGQAFGRAYDNSEITGDHGVAGLMELRYANLGNFEDIRFSPYAFYDIGKVWNKNVSVGQEKSPSGSSAGMGLRFDTSLDISGNIGVAFPLTRDISTPIYDKDDKGYRLIFQLTRSF